MLINHQGVVSMNEHTAQTLGVVIGGAMFLLLTLLVCYALIPVIYGSDYRTLNERMMPIEVNLVQNR